MTHKPPFDIARLRASAAAQGPSPHADAADFPCHADVERLTPAIGVDRCASILGVLRKVAERVTGGDYILTVSRDPSTGERCGYRIYTREQAVADRIARRIKPLIP